MSLPLVPIQVTQEYPMLPGWGDIVLTFRWTNPDGESRHHVEYVQATADEDELVACIETVCRAITGEWGMGGRGRRSEDE